MKYPLRLLGNLHETENTQFAYMAWTYEKYVE